MTESLKGVKRSFIDLIAIWKIALFERTRKFCLEHCLGKGFLKTLKILFLLFMFLLAGLGQLRAQTLTIENEYLSVEFLQDLPAVDRYVLKSNNQVIYGDIVYWMYWAQIFHEGSFYDTYPNIDSITNGSDRICYHLRGELDSQQAVTFDLCYTLSGNSVELSFGNVQESPGYKLIVVRPPDLLTVRADQGGAKLVFPYAEGLLIDVATTTSGNYEDCNTGGWTHAMLMAMLYHQGALAICSYDHLDIVMGERVFDHPDKGRLGAIDIYFYYRHPPTNFELASFVDVFDEQTTSLSTKLTFLADYDQDGNIDWIDGAKFLRDQVQAVPEARYVSSWMTKLGRNGIANISQHLETIEKLYHLTDHNKIHSYLLDYNPPMFSIFGYDGDLDPEWASHDELKQVFETAGKSFNTFLSFHDNYLDYYPGTPGYDPALRVVNPDGAVLDGWPLPGYSGAYKADAYEHAVQLGLQRVKDTLSRYPIKESHHIDAFHFLPFRDYSLESPSSREKNRRGIKLIIDEFNKYGVDVTAEGLTGFFVGPGTGWFLDTPRILEHNLPFSGAEAIPLIEFIYHGKTLYGLYEDIYVLPPEQVQIYTFLEPLLLGAGSASHITFTAPDDLELDKFYLIDLPWMALNQRFMKDYIANGSYRKIAYDDDTFVEINYDSNTYTVQVDGRVIGRDYMTFFPKNENTFLIFSRDAKTIAEPLPDGWGENTILLKLTEDGVNENIPFQLTSGIITFQAEANTPYKLMKLVPSPNDFDGDRKSDITVWRPGDGYWYIISSQDGSIMSQQWGSGALNDIPVAGDYDGDGKTDCAVLRPGEYAYWYILKSSDGGVIAEQWGSSTLNDVLVPGDYDGDGKTDIAVWRPGEGFWYIINSKDGSIVSQQWGAGYEPYNDKPVPGDYDGDGKTDIAVWRSGDGYWYIVNSKDQSVTATQWGSNGLNDVLVPGDYDGDGKTDIAVWRPAEGYWYIINSKDESITATQWGAGYAPYNDVPVPGDYDGDGKTDIAIWRPGDGYWYIINSKDGSITATQWGAGYDPYNDEPISQKSNW